MMKVIVVAVNFVLDLEGRSPTPVQASSTIYTEVQNEVDAIKIKFIILA